MNRFVQLAVGLGVAGVMALASMPANAGPVAPQAPLRISVDNPGVIKVPKTMPKGGKAYTAKISKGKWSAVKKVSAAFSPAHVNSRGQVDARWVKKKIPKVSDRYPVEAGVWYWNKSWSQVKHITTGEKKAVINWAKTHSGPNPKTLRVAGATKLTGEQIVARALVEANQPGAMLMKKAPTVCTGKTGYNNDTAHARWWVWLNSCDSQNVSDLLETGYTGLGLLGVILGVVGGGVAAIVPAVYGAELWVLKKYFDNRRNRSDLNAVIIRVSKSPYLKGGTWQVPFVIYPQ